MNKIKKWVVAVTATVAAVTALSLSVQAADAGARATDGVQARALHTDTGWG